MLNILKHGNELVKVFAIVLVILAYFETRKYINIYYNTTLYVDVYAQSASIPYLQCMYVVHYSLGKYHLITLLM